MRDDGNRAGQHGGISRALAYTALAQRLSGWCALPGSALDHLGLVDNLGDAPSEVIGPA